MSAPPGIGGQVEKEQDENATMRTLKGWVRVLLLPLFVLQFALDAWLGERLLIFNSWSWLRAVGYQITHQPWYAFYAEDFLLGQRLLGEPALWLGALMLLLRPLAGALLIGAAIRWARAHR